MNVVQSKFLTPAYCSVVATEMAMKLNVDYLLHIDKYQII